jgi:hypothetical protein
MARRSVKRRRALIGISTLVLGASGFVSSGAFSTGSQGSLGDNWIQVAGTNQGITFESPQQVNNQDSSEGQEGGEEGSEGVADADDGNTDDDADDGNTDDDADDGNTDDDADDGNTDDDPLTSQLEVIVDPSEDNIVDPSGAPLTDGALVSWTGSIHETSLTRGTENGLLLGIASDKINKKAVTQYGTFDSTIPGDDVVFIVANGGSAESDSSLPSVDVTMRLYADDNPRPIESDQIRFPYRVLDTDRNVTATGRDLTDPSGGSIELATGEVIEVIIEFDTTDSDADLKTLSEVRFFANGGNN